MTGIYSDISGRYSDPGAVLSAAITCGSPNSDHKMPFPVEIRYVNDTEAKLGVKFPASFVVRMTNLNGGMVTTDIDDWQLYPFLDSSDRKHLSRTCNDIVRETQQARQSPHFPPDAVAIAANGGGDHLVLIPLPDAPHVLSHEVFWWDHETGEINHVADDFADL